MGLSLGAAVGALQAQDLNTGGVFSGGGGSASNATFLLRGTVSQTAVGTAGNAAFAVGSGFWYRIRERVVIGIEEAAADPLEIPADYVLDQNYPNPFNPRTTIPYGLPEPAVVRIEVFNVLGQLVRVLIDREQPAGFHSVTWDARSQRGEALPSGLYLVRMSAGSVTKTRKVTLLR